MGAVRMRVQTSDKHKYIYTLSTPSFLLLFLSDIWTHILTAEIIKICSDTETNSPTVHLGWPEGKYIPSNVLGELFL